MKAPNCSYHEIFILQVVFQFKLSYLYLVDLNKCCSFFQTDLEKRVCQVTAKHGIHSLGLTISFPSGYPKLHPPTFRYSFGTTMDSSTKAELLRVSAFEFFIYYLSCSNMRHASDMLHFCRFFYHKLIFQALRSTANQFLRKKKPCLEPCIKVLVSQMKSLPVNHL